MGRSVPVGVATKKAVAAELGIARSSLYYKRKYRRETEYSLLR